MDGSGAGERAAPSRIAGLTHSNPTMSEESVWNGSAPECRLSRPPPRVPRGRRLRHVRGRTPRCRRHFGAARSPAAGRVPNTSARSGARSGRRSAHRMIRTRGRRATGRAAIRAAPSCGSELDGDLGELQPRLVHFVQRGEQLGRVLGIGSTIHSSAATTAAPLHEPSPPIGRTLRWAISSGH